MSLEHAMLDQRDMSADLTGKLEEALDVCSHHFQRESRY